MSGARLSYFYKVAAKHGKVETLGIATIIIPGDNTCQFAVRGEYLAQAQMTSGRL